MANFNNIEIKIADRSTGTYKIDLKQKTIYLKTEKDFICIPFELIAVFSAIIEMSEVDQKNVKDKYQINLKSL